MNNTIKAVLFDFGGVLAEEGFHEGLMTIGSTNGLDPEIFFKTVDALIYETAYLIGGADEAVFWSVVRSRTGITGSDVDLRNEILNRFVLRPDMIASADHMRSQGITIALLSDQTNWLEELDQQTGLFRHFDVVFNSFRIHKSKRDASVFRDVCSVLGVHSVEALFIDDNSDHIKRAQGQGLQTIHFTGKDEYEKQLEILRENGMLT